MPRTDTKQKEAPVPVRLLDGTMAIPCSRCGRLCKLGDPPNPDARLLRRATAPGGYCPDCAATEFLRGTPVLAELLDTRGPECLRAPHVQAQFASILASGHADCKPEELRWENIIAHWHLPIPGEKCARRREGLETDHA